MTPPVAIYLYPRTKPFMNKKTNTILSWMVRLTKTQDIEVASLSTHKAGRTKNITKGLREGVKKKTNLFGTLSQTMGRWVQRWVQSPKLFSENNHSVIFTANIQKCPKTCNT